MVRLGAAVEVAICKDGQDEVVVIEKEGTEAADTYRFHEPIPRGSFPSQQIVIIVGTFIRELFDSTQHL